MSKLVEHETYSIIAEADTKDFFEHYNDVDPMSSTDLALFAGIVTLPQSVTVQPAFESFIGHESSANNFVSAQ